ncbi:endoplasmic reticulum membrane adapter protein XK isoform X1 [Ahaetulla prasina]|uniref:endoplasmic reticulum membrane adapter protein XK isoform X1 n=1 Tax=Ahaetulla prasina TaxID=499056 RepID=UPI00264A26D9|nr:endoplasmic reticulum membrane adapter protein XK isoform X1 [Ahaetulla prasina]
MKFPGSVLVSLFFFVAETAIALYLSSTYRSAGDRIWQLLTLLFALLPCIMVQFSLVFIHRDLSRDRPLVLLLHILQLGPIVRCVEVFYIYFHAGRVEEPYVSITKKRQMPKDGHSEEVEKEVGQAEGKLFTHRSAFSRASVIQAFLGSAPQLTLQLYICVLQQEITAARNFTLHFNVLNKQLQGVEKTAKRMFCDIKTFERKLQVFERDIEKGQLKYFPNLKMHLENSTTFADNPKSHQEIYKEFSSTVAAAKVNFSNRFLQFCKMETILCFLTSPDKAKFEELDLSCLHWLDLGNLEMELLEFQESSIWKNKFYGLCEKLEKIDWMTKDSTIISENELLKVWNSLPNNFKSMKALGIAFLTLLGSSYAREQLFSALNYIKSDTRNSLKDDLTAVFVALKLTKYEPRLDKLSASIHQQKSH